MTIVDLFAGPGGWDYGATLAGLDGAAIVGLEADPDTCKTRDAAGLTTVRTDVAAYPPARLGPVHGLIASPPCTAFSMAGNGEGRALLGRLVEAMRARDWLWGRDWTAGGAPGGEVHDPTIWLPLEAARWVLEVGPEWVAMEQVPPAVPLWEALAEVLRAEGYSCWVGVLCAADYGVPQTRRRAFLLASRRLEVHRPAPTHAEGGAGGLLPWQSMGEALDWPVGVVGFPRQADSDDALELDGTAYRARDLFDTDGPAPTLTEKVRSWQRWQLRANLHANAAVRTLDQPAPTIAFGNAYADWAWLRPATTIACDDRVHAPGHKVNADDIARLGEEEARARYGDRAGTDAIRVTVEEAAVLQGFPRDWPFHGSTRSQFGQVGNAVPPPLAAHLLAQVAGRQL